MVEEDKKSGDVLRRIRDLESQRELLRNDQLQWRKGVELIASGLDEQNPSDLCCARLFEKALSLRAQLEVALTDRDRYRHALIHARDETHPDSHKFWDESEEEESYAHWVARKALLTELEAVKPKWQTGQVPTTGYFLTESLAGYFVVRLYKIGADPEQRWIGPIELPIENQEAK